MIWLRIPAADETVDPEWQLRTNDYKETAWTIQDCRSYGGKFTVVEHGDDWIKHHKSFTQLPAAKKYALELYNRRTAS